MLTRNKACAGPGRGAGTHTYFGIVGCECRRRCRCHSHVIHHRDVTSLSAKTVDECSQARAPISRSHVTSIRHDSGWRYPPLPARHHQLTWQRSVPEVLSMLAQLPIRHRPKIRFGGTILGIEAGNFFRLEKFCPEARPFSTLVAFLAT